MFSDQQVMLCLAGLSYRGFFDLGLGRPDVEISAAAIGRGLEQLAPLQASYRLVWGPAHYRGSFTLFDEKSIYVVQDRRAPARYVVVLRGTNPISLADWVFGDLWTGRQTPWRYGDGSERLSLSAALSQSIVQEMRATGPRHDVSARLWQSIDAQLAQTRDELARFGAPIARGVERALAPLRRQFLQLLQRLTRVSSELGRGADELQLRACVELWRSALRSQLFELLDHAAELAGTSLDRALLALLEADGRLQNSLGRGASLRTFLAAAVEAANGPVEVVVAGHSKGGALASTCALWLAETQGESVAPAERWDPGRRASVQCYSFAAPTAGNAPFALRSNRLLAGRCQRIWNKLDIVPHAWATDELGLVPSLYLPGIERVALVSELVALIRHKVAALGYTHVAERGIRLDGKLDPNKHDFFAQLAHQHFDAYLAELDLTRYGINQPVLFDQLGLAS